MQDHSAIPVEGLHKQLKELYSQLQGDMQKQWDRDLPFEELLFDRWGRARQLGFGKDASIYHNSYVYGEVTVGAHTWIGPYTLLDGTGGLEIGRYCSISAGVQIYTHNTVKWAVSGGKHAYERRPVKIGDCCFIGPQSVIRDGVEIGAHVVVGASSFVNKDVPSFSIVAGCPAIVIGNVELQDDGTVTLSYKE